MAVTSSNAALGTGGVEDLPRTLRREREARERDRVQQSSLSNSGLASGLPLSAGSPSGAYVPEPTMPDHLAISGNTVTDIRIPFFRLMMFGFKLVFAAIPALILLFTILWLAGHALMTFFPWLVKVQLLIKVP
jgi:hypothetical protein